MYVIIRTSDHKFVSRGGESSYTSKLEYAKAFATKEEAEKDRCIENERVVHVNTMLPKLK